MASNRRLLTFLAIFVAVIGGAIAFLTLRDIPAPQQRIEKPLDAPAAR